MPHSVSVFGSRRIHRSADRAAALPPSVASSSGRVTARSDVGRRLDDLYPLHRVPLELEELDLDRHAEVDAAVVAYPHGAAAPSSPTSASGASAWSTSARTSACSDPDVYGRWYREHQAPELLGDAVYGLPERYREEIRGAALVANPGCYPTATLLALAPLARAGPDRRRRHRRQVGRVGRRARRHREDPFRHRGRERQRLRSPEPPPHPRDRTGARDARRADVRITFTPHLVPLDQGELVCCYVTPSAMIDGPELEQLYADAYASEPFVELASSHPACATCARRTSAGSRSTATSAPGS